MCALHASVKIWRWTSRRVDLRSHRRLCLFRQLLNHGALGRKVIERIRFGACLSTSSRRTRLYWSVKLFQSVQVMLDISECSGEFEISDLKAFMSIFLSLLCLRYIFEGLGRENAIVHSTALWSDGRSDTIWINLIIFRPLADQ